MQFPIISFIVELHKTDAEIVLWPSGAGTVPLG